MTEAVMFPTFELRALLWGDAVERYELISKEIVSANRWTTNYRLVFKFGDKFYENTFITDSRESREERHKDHVLDENGVYELEPYEATVTLYRRVSQS